MRFAVILFGWILSALAFAIGPAAARIGIDVDLTSQVMHVTTDSGERFVWPVSTARAGYVTPVGTYRPIRLEKMHYSRKYDMSPMPHSIFYHGGYAIHGTHATRALGHTASHGCIRLSPQNAARLFEMVRAEGAVITISGASPRHRPLTAHARRHASPHLAFAPADTNPLVPALLRR